MSFSIREVSPGSGERLPILVEGGPLGLPVQGVVEFTLTILRTSGRRRNSIRKRLDALGLTLQFLSSRWIDIVARTASQTFLSIEELVALADACRALQHHLPDKLAELTCCAWGVYAAATGLRPGTGNSRNGRAFPQSL